MRRKRIVEAMFAPGMAPRLPAGVSVEEFMAMDHGGLSARVLAARARLDWMTSDDRPGAPRPAAERASGWAVQAALAGDSDMAAAWTEFGRDQSPAVFEDALQKALDKLTSGPGRPPRAVTGARRLLQDHLRSAGHPEDPARPYRDNLLLALSDRLEAEGKSHKVIAGRIYQDHGELGLAESTIRRLLKQLRADRGSTKPRN